jgi:anti-anti-sigma factor
VNPAPFEASATEVGGGVHIVSVRGELDLGTAPDLEPSLDQAVSSADALVLVDLGECEFIDSTGIALIVRAWQRLDGDDGAGRLVLCSGNDQVRRVLEITGLDLSIPIHRTRSEALTALREKAEPQA